MVKRYSVGVEEIQVVTMLANMLGKDELCCELLGLMRSHFAKGQKYVVEHRPIKEKKNPLKLLKNGEVPGPDVGQLS